MNDEEYRCDWCGNFYQFSEHQEDTDPEAAMSYCPEHVGSEGSDDE